MTKSLKDIIEEGQETHRKAREVIDEFDKVNAKAENLEDVIRRGQAKFKTETEPTYWQKTKMWLYNKLR